MIKISKHFRIHALTVVMLALAFYFHMLQGFLVPYGVMLLHELCHAVAALAIGLKISDITLYPFGVNLKLSNKMVYSVCDEIILYAAGPLFNIACALAAMLVYNVCKAEAVRYFYMCNIMLFCMNMLPAVPLDGGIILKKLLSYRLGAAAAGRIMTVVSTVIALCETALGVYVVCKTHVNFSVLLFSALMIGNIFTQTEKYDSGFLKELMFYKKKDKARVTHIIADRDDSYEKIAKSFTPHSYGIVYVTNPDGKILKTLTETEVIQKLLNSNITV